MVRPISRPLSQDRIERRGHPTRYLINAFRSIEDLADPARVSRRYRAHDEVRRDAFF